MSSFHEIQFPDDIAYGVTGGPEFVTDITSTKVGVEQRNLASDEGRCKYNAAYGVKREEQYEQLLRFFRARKGRTYGFRFKDWFDYKATNQIIIPGENLTEYQLIKTYTDESGQDIRKITKPVEGTLALFIDGHSTLDWTCDYTTGKVTFTNSPLHVNATMGYSDGVTTIFQLKDESGNPVYNAINNSLFGIYVIGWATPTFTCNFTTGEVVFDEPPGIQLNWLIGVNDSAIQKKDYLVQPNNTGKILGLKEVSFANTVDGKNPTTASWTFNPDTEIISFDEEPGKTVDANIGTADGVQTNFPIAYQLNDAKVTQVKVNGTIVTEGWVYDETLMAVVFTIPPAEGTILASYVILQTIFADCFMAWEIRNNFLRDAIVTADFQFDVPVRFDIAQMQASYDDFSNFSWSSIPLVELIDE